MYIVGTARWNNYPTIDITRRGGRKKKREKGKKGRRRDLSTNIFRDRIKSSCATLSNNNVVNRRLKFKKKKERKKKEPNDRITRRNKIILNRVITSRYYINENEPRTSSNYPREGGKDLSRSTTQMHGMHGISVINHDVTRAPEPEDKKVRK